MEDNLLGPASLFIKYGQTSPPRSRTILTKFGAPN